MAKTKLVVKDDQVLVDVDIIFEQIIEFEGDWKKVKELYEELKKSLKIGNNQSNS